VAQTYVHMITPLQIHPYTWALSKETMASCLTIQGYSAFLGLGNTISKYIKLSAFDASIRSCMHMSETLLCKHVSSEEQMTARLSISRH
jgi:hypothetical protein